MPNRLKTIALAGAMAAGVAGVAMAQTCPPGYTLQGNMCYPPASNPISGAAAGGAAGAAAGGAAAGPVGALVGGALGTATGAVTGAVNTAGQIVGGTVGAVTGQPTYPAEATPAYGSSTPPTVVITCAPGYMLYQGACYPAQ